MRTSSWIPGVIILALAQMGSIAVGCSDAAPGEGTGGSGGALGGSSGSGGSGGQTGGTGGGTGGGAVSCDAATSLGGTCGACELSIADYCSGRDCDMPQELEFCWGGSRSVTSSGCGYHRVEHKDGITDPKPLSVDIWDQDSGELVYHYSRSADVDECQPDVIAGEEPECSSYSLICDSGNACPIPPHRECFGSCFQGCVGGFDVSCGELEALCLAGQGGQGGLGGGGP